MKSYNQKYTLAQRKQKSRLQIKNNPGKLPLIAEPHKKSKLSSLQNPKFVCEQEYKLNVICAILQKKIDKTSLKPTSNIYMFVGNNLLNREQTIQSLYKKYKNQDGFLYITYGEMETFG